MSEEIANGIQGLDRVVYLKFLRLVEEQMLDYPVDGTRLEKYEFYSALDDSYRQPWLVDALLNWLWHPNLILTGQFGHYVVERIEALELKKDYLLFNGKLREGDPPVVLKFNNESRNFFEDGYTPTWFLLDDSYYSGRTRFILDSYMRKNYEYWMTGTIVLYNGASRWHPQVNAMYSWYMVHGLDLEDDFKPRREW